MSKNVVNDSDLTEILKSLKEWRNDLQNPFRAFESTIDNITIIIKGIRNLPKSAFEIDNGISEILSYEAILPEFETQQKKFQMLREIISKEKVKHEMEFFSTLKSDFKEEGVDVIGNPPNLIVPPFQLETLLKSGIVKLYFGKELLSNKLMLDSKEIIRAYKRYQRRICGRRFDAEVFISTLFQAYNRVLRLKELSGQSNRKINIIDVLNEFVFVNQTQKFHRSHRKEDFKSYPRSYFLYDLFQLQRSKVLTFEDFKLSFTSATIDTTGKSDKMLYLPNLRGDFRPIMAIEFLEVKK